MQVDVRVAGCEDASTVSSILVEAADWLAAKGVPLWAPGQLTVDQVAPDCGAGRFRLAWSATEALGTMRLTPSDPRFWPEAADREAVYLHRLAVRRRAARGVVSNAMLRHAAEFAGAKGVGFLRLDCEASRPALRRFYEAFGFEYHSDRTVQGVHVARYQLPLRSGGTGMAPVAGPGSPSE